MCLLSAGYTYIFKNSCLLYISTIKEKCMNLRERVREEDIWKGLQKRQGEGTQCNYVLIEQIK